MAQGEFGSYWKNMNPMHSADDYTAWNVMVKRTVLSSQITIFCLSSMCSLTSIPQFFLAAVLPLLWPAALPAPPLPHEQTTTCQMDFLYTMPYCIISSFPNTFGGERDQAMSRRCLRSPSLRVWKSQTWTNPSLNPPSLPLPRTGGHRAALSCVWVAHSQWEMIAVISCHAYQVCNSEHCKHLCFLVIVQKCMSPLQHHGQLSRWILLHWSAL